MQVGDNFQVRGSGFPAPPDLHVLTASTKVNDTAFCSCNDAIDDHLTVSAIIHIGKNPFFCLGPGDHFHLDSPPF